MTDHKFSGIVLRHEMLGVACADQQCRKAASALEKAAYGGTRIDLFCATVQHDARCGRYYAAHANRAVQALLGVGAPPIFSEAALQILNEGNGWRETMASAEYQPIAGVLNHLVSGATLGASFAVSCVAGVALGAVGGAGAGAVGLTISGRTARAAAQAGVIHGAVVGFAGAGAFCLWGTAGVINRGVAYGLGGVALATRIANHLAGAALFGAAGVVRGAAAAAYHVPKVHDLPAPRPAPEDFAFA